MPRATRSGATALVLLLAVSPLSAGVLGAPQAQAQGNAESWWDLLVNLFAQLRGDMDPDGLKSDGEEPVAPASAEWPPETPDLGGDMDPDG